MSVQITDDEIRQIILRRKRKEKERKKRKRRITLAVCLVFLAGILGFSFSTGGGIFTLFQTRGVIFIDAGHGGEDPGAEALGRKEKDDTLELALKVRKYLRRKRFKVVMSRTDDVNVDRPKRAEMANEAEAKLMVSLHRNQSDGEGQGVEAWIHSGGNSSATLLADNILRNLEKEGFTYRKIGTGTFPDASDNYSENRYSTMPSCIIEVGFISNESDNQRFDSNLSGNAKAIADGIETTYAALYEKDSEE